MVYRPTIRYDEIFKTYVDALFDATHLDRNQIIRAALFTAAHSKEFYQLLKPYQIGDVTLPSPQWSLEQHNLWLKQSAKLKMASDVNIEISSIGGKNKDNQNSRLTIETEKKPCICSRPAEKQGKRIPANSIKVSGGIVFTLD